MLHYDNFFRGLWNNLPEHGSVPDCIKDIDQLSMDIKNKKNELESMEHEYSQKSIEIMIMLHDDWKSNEIREAINYMCDSEKGE